MFDFLKKKIGGFIDNLTKTEDEKQIPSGAEERIIEKQEIIEEKTRPEPEIEKPIEKRVEKQPVEPKPVPEPPEKKTEKQIGKAPEKKIESKPAIQAHIEKKETAVKQIEKKEAVQKAPEKRIEERIEKPPTKQIQKPIEKPLEKKAEKPIETKPALQKAPEPESAEPVIQKPIEPEPRIELPIEKKEILTEPAPKEKERVKLGVFSAIKGLVTGEVEISEKDVVSLLDDLELELLEADVELSVAGAIRDDLKERLSGAKIKRGELHTHVGSVIKETLISILTSEKDFDLLERVKNADMESRPIKIVFLGINGAGKTTTMAKVARLLMDNKCKVVFAAADTFRAAAIEQLSTHAERLDVRVIKRDYGSDPTSVAYDAVGYGKAHGIDAVLIDTAGRQDTNISLINEMKKMDRVIKPDLKIYIGESIAGNAIIEQVQSFDREIGIDGVILTKMDCDPKGGTMLSISKASGIPILYIGTGQGYGDLERFDARKIAERIVG